jgi:endonuclease G
MKFHLLAFISFLLVSLAAWSAEEIVNKKYFTLNYNEDHEVANWASYELDHTKLQNCVKRTDNFRPDPQVSTGTAVAADYRGSGYDRGHLVPAGDMKFSKEAMQDTFFFSNMAPQPPGFNRGKWGELENLMRSWGVKYKKIWIVTGPILKDNLHTIGQRNRISIPEQFFKVILREKDTSYEGIGFIMATTVPSPDLKAYVTTIDKVEELSGFDFFKFIDDKYEEKIERSVDIKKWDFTGKFEYFPCQASAAR